MKVIHHNPDHFGVFYPKLSRKAKHRMRVVGQTRKRHALEPDPEPWCEQLDGGTEFICFNDKVPPGPCLVEDD